MIAVGKAGNVIGEETVQTGDGIAGGATKTGGLMREGATPRPIRGVAARRPGLGSIDLQS